MSDFNQEEDPLEAWLDEESDVSFGYPAFREHNPVAQVDKSGHLHSWNAEDFSSIYVRFRPHLVRHAKRFVQDNIVAEEIVQEAFLYLMTALPEIDNEVGVLKFLKWKVRLLALDVFRARSASKENIEDPSTLSELAESTVLESDLEAAEDLAIIQHALAKISPRHRQVLLDSAYSDKPINEIATELSLDQNAARQLLWRARKAFKSALVGEAHIAGKSASEVLSIAAKRAAKEARKNIGAVGTFALLISVGIGLVSSVENGGSQPSEVLAVEEIKLEVSSDQPSDKQIPDGDDLAEEVAKVEPEQPLRVSSLVQEPEPEEATVMTAAITPLESAVQTEVEEGSNPIMGLTTDAYGAQLSTSSDVAGFYTNSYTAYLSDVFVGQSVEVFGGTGISAFIDWVPAAFTVEHVFAQIWVEGQLLLGVPSEMSYSITTENDQTHIVVVSENFNVVDQSLNIYKDTPLANAKIETQLFLNANGNIERASLYSSIVE